MIYLIIIILIPVWVWSVHENTYYKVYGGIFKDKNIDISNYTLNPISNDIIGNYNDMRDFSFISSVYGRSFLWKYYVARQGLVFRGTKLHKDIKKKFKELKEKQNEQSLQITRR